MTLEHKSMLLRSYTEMTFLVTQGSGSVYSVAGMVLLMDHVSYFDVMDLGQRGLFHGNPRCISVNGPNKKIGFHIKKICLG